MRSRVLVGAACLAAVGCAGAEPEATLAVDAPLRVGGAVLTAPQIHAYLAEHVASTSRGGRARCAYTALGQAGDRVFLETACTELVVEGDSLVEGSGRGGPVALRFAAEGSRARIVGHELPEDGGGYAASVRRIFSAAAAERVLDGADGARRDTLRAHLRASASAGARSTAELLEARVPRAAAGDPGWAYRRTASADLDGDGADEQLVLIADVALSTRGEPLWEDGHRWQVYVEEADGARTHVYGRFVPQGTVAAHVGRTAAGHPAILVVEQSPSGLGVYEVEYGGPDRATLRSRLVREIVASGA